MRLSFVPSAVAFVLALGASGPHAQEAAAVNTSIATVNGVAVTLGEMIAVRAELPAQYQQLPDEALYDGLRQQLVDQRILALAAEAAGLAAQPAVARALALQRQGILATYFISDAITERVTAEAVQAAYDARVASTPAVEEVRASHILVAEEAMARDLRAQIDAGADFAALAAEHGTDGTKNQGGDLGFFAREVMVSEFADAAFAMAVGEISQPVQSQFGWHLIKVSDRRQRPAPTLEELRPEIEQELGREAARALMEELRAVAAVTIPEDRPGIAAMRDDALIAR